MIGLLRALWPNRRARPEDDSRMEKRLEGAMANGVRTYSQRVSPPFCGQVQIVESGQARALTLDGASWEIQFIHASVVSHGPGDERIERRARHIDTLPHEELVRIAASGAQDGKVVDERMRELARGIADATLPFPANDEYEYWLLDATDGSPLAFIFSCADPNDIKNLPVRPEWTALPAAVMPIARTDDELAREAPPVNYRFERLIAERAGPNPKAHWFRRHAGDTDDFPPLLVREDWPGEQERDLCRRYLHRQAPRLLMLHGLVDDVRLRLERAVRPNLSELARFQGLYPAVVDQELMTAMRVEARLRDAGGQ